MRMLFGLTGLLLTLLILVWLVRTQLSAQVGVASQSATGGAQGEKNGQSASAALKQFKQSLDQALKARPASVPE